MEPQLQFKMPVNVDTLKSPTNQVIFPITRFHHFHKDVNINDWKNLLIAKSAAFEKEGNMDFAMELHRAAEFFINPGDHNRKMGFVNHSP